MAEVTFTEIDSILADFINTLENRKREIMEPSSKIIAEDTRLRFRTQLDPRGRPWKGLKPSTLRAKRRNGPDSRPILTDSTDLRKSIKQFADNKKAIVGTNVPYAKYHQRGTNNVPVREFLGLSNTSRRKIISLIKRVLKSKGKA